MGYEKVFEKPYSTGWKDLPDRTTPVTAAIMNDYDEAIEHIENHLEGTPAIFPIQATGGMTQPVGIDENGRLVTIPTSGGGGSASEITYDNTESELESTDVQGAIDELAAGAGEKVTPVPKTEDMTQEVGIDENGELWTVPGGGGSGSSGLTKLWENTNSPAGITSGTMELSDDYTNYDFLIFSSVRGNTSLQGNGIISTEDLDISKTLTSNLITIPGGAGAYGVITVTDSTHLAIDNCSADYGFRVIYGYKAGGGSSKKETILLNTPFEITTTGMTISLSDSITNYDELIIATKETAGSTSFESRFAISNFTYGSLSNQYRTAPYQGNGYLVFYPDNTGDNLIETSASYCTITKIIGVKY